MHLGGLVAELGLGDEEAVVHALRDGLQHRHVGHHRRAVLLVVALAAQPGQHLRQVDAHDLVVQPERDARREHGGEVDERQLRRWEAVGEEGVLVRARVPPDARVQPLRLEQHEVEEGAARAGEPTVALVGDGVARRVARVLSALDEREDDRVFLPDERLTDVLQLE